MRDNLVRVQTVNCSEKLVLNGLVLSAVVKSEPLSRRITGHRSHAQARACCTRPGRLWRDQHGGALMCSSSSRLSLPSHCFILDDPSAENPPHFIFRIQVLVLNLEKGLQGGSFFLHLLDESKRGANALFHPAHTRLHLVFEVVFTAPRCKLLTSSFLLPLLLLLLRHERASVCQRISPLLAASTFHIVVLLHFRLGATHGVEQGKCIEGLPAPGRRRFLATGSVIFFLAS